MNAQTNILLTRRVRLLSAIILPLLIAGCIEKPVGPVTGKTVTIEGKVLRSDNRSPIVGAIVTLLKSPSVSAKTDSSGSYRLTFEAESRFSALMIASGVTGFALDSARVQIIPGEKIAQDFLLEEVLVSGLPDQSHFTMSIASRNFPGLAKLDATNIITVRVGDKFGNPVSPGIKVNFSTLGGTIDGFAFTDNTGLAHARLYGGNPQPVDPVFGRGFTWVKASTLGEEGTVQDSLLVLFSGTPQITGPASGFTLRDGGTQSFEYTVADENGNPLTEGTTISVSVSGSGDVKLDGDIGVVLLDTQDKNRYTRYAFTLTDTKPLDTGRDQELSVTISVVGSNGDKSYTFTGKLLAPDGSVGAGTGPVAAIALVQLERNAISVREVGGDETSTVTFEARDSVGRPVDQVHQATLSFSLSGSAVEGVVTNPAYAAPSSALSDPQTGRVRTTVNAGFKAGVLQVVAQTVVGTKVIRSAPVLINIYGGFPVLERFSIVTDKQNVIPCVFPIPKVRIRVLAGDKFGNPVRPGTAVYFTSTGGVINVPATAYTDVDGFADAELAACNPIPPNGIARVSATTVGEHGETVYRETAVVFSQTTGVLGPPSGFTLLDGGSQSFEYTVADGNGNPLSAGTKISVSVTGSSDVKLGGNTDVVLPDTQDKDRFTRFSFTLTDTKPLDTDGSKQLTVTISVTSANGDRSYSFTGTLLGQAVTGSGTAATIALIGLSRNAISVREVGGEETSIVTFEVRDSVGRPIDAAHQVTVSFTFQQNPPGGGEFLYPLSTPSDALTGRVQTTVNSGTKAGVVQVVAQAIVGSRTIRSAPVIIDIFGGFPVQSHFSIGADKLNFPGWDILKLTNTIKVLAGDRWSNPVRPGTAVYFSTTGGVITASGYTDAFGNADATLLSGNPQPIDPVRGAGFARVSATTVGQFGETVTDTMFVLFSGTSSIKNVNPTSFTVPSGGASGPINFEVSDQNGNPLSAGTTITVTLQYTPPPNTTINLSVTGDVAVTLGDTQAKGPGTTQFSFQVVDQTVGGVPSSIPVTVVISVKSPNGNPPNASLTGTVG